MIQAMKDKALSKGAKIAINQQIHEYGEITKLKLNSKFNSIDLEVVLHGESESMKVQVEHYEITEDNHFRISGVTTSRSWINTLISNHFEGREFRVPLEYAQMLKVII